MIVLKSIPLLLLFCILSFDALSTNSIKAAKIIDSPSEYSMASSTRAGAEGWAFATYVINPEGEVDNIVITDYSGKKRYIKETVDYIKRLEYEPATINNVAVVSHGTMFLTHGIVGKGISTQSVSPGFMGLYEKALSDATSPGGFDKNDVTQQVSNLRKNHTKNLNEIALLSWLDSIVSYQQQDYYDYFRHTQAVVALRNYVPTAIIHKALTNLYQIQVYLGLYSGALNTVEIMDVTQGINLSAEVKQDLLSQVKTLMQADMLKIYAKLFELGSSVFEVTGQQVSIENVQGKLEKVELRCLGYYSSFENDLEASIQIPADAHQCSLLIQGEPNTTFEIKQQS